ncbi:MAG: dihydrofolate reductase [Actinomycetota bacterium]|nr:dihydrofolate reductase [Actinomycetota bacterium]
MPWHVPEDMAHFKDLTMGTTVIMGRRTWDSFPDRFRPLPGRRNIVVTRDLSWSADGAEAVHSVEAALALDPSPWIIGGAQLYAATLARADRLEVTEIAVSPDGDAHAPAIDPALWATTPASDDGPWLTSRTGLDYRFLSFTRA